MAVHGFVLKCSTTALLLALLVQTHAAPVTSTMQTPAATPSSTPSTSQQQGNMEGSASSPQQEATEEEGSGEHTQADVAFTPNAEIQAIVTTESPETTFDPCSTTSPANQAHAIASFYKGLMVVDSNTFNNHLQVSACMQNNAPYIHRNTQDSPNTNS